jgi:sensor histidine kinase YesM
MQLRPDRWLLHRYRMRYPWAYMENLSPHKNVKRYTSWSSLGYTVLFCLAIALLLWVMDFINPLLPLITVSLSIGLSINLTFIMAQDRLSQFLSPYLAAVPLTAVGLSIGLAIAGLLVAGKPTLFFSDDYATLLIGVFFAIVGSSIFMIRSQLLAAQAQLAEAEAQHQAQEKLLLETELKLLQAQIEPHFLFNTLSNVVGLIHKDPQAAEETLLNLTTLLRSSLQRTRDTTTTLAQELTMVEAYLKIQSIRMQDRLRYDFIPAGIVEAGSELHDQMQAHALPPLLLQPLVENAVKHGIDPSETGGNVSITVTTANNRLDITIADTGVGMSTTAKAGTGLDNVRQRLHALYGERASLTVTENKPTGVVVHLSIDGENGDH